MKTIGTIRIVLVTILVSALCSTALADLGTATYPTVLPSTPPHVVTVNPALQGPSGVYMWDYVDIGDVISEAGHGLNDWGQIEGSGLRGGYGSEDDLRVIWGDLDATGARWASINMDFGPTPGQNKYLALRWLDGISNPPTNPGIADDSFEIDIYPLGGGSGGAGGAPIWNGFVLNGTAFGTEAWFDVGLFNVGPITGWHTIELTATGNAWGGQGTWGQVGFSEMATFVPAPGATLLCVIGLGAIAWIRRRVS